MRLIQFKLLTVITVALLFAACTHGSKSSKGLVTVAIDMNKVDTIPLGEATVIPLETNDSSLLYGIDLMEIVDDKFVIYANNFIKTFDQHTGAYCGAISSRGQGPGEYLFIGRVWSDNDTVKIYDNETERELNYTADGEFISDRKLFEDIDFSTLCSPSSYIRMPDGKGYIAINTSTGGSTPTNPVASYLDSDFKLVRNVPGRDFREGSSLTDRISADHEHNRILMWEAFRDTLFAITPDSVKAIYAFDFGRQSLPSDIQGLAETVDRNMKFMDGKHIPYISMSHAFHQYDGYLYFSFIDGSSHVYLARLDTDTDQIKVYYIDGEGRYTQDGFMTLIDGNIYVQFNDTSDPEANPVLISIPVTALK